MVCAKFANTIKRYAVQDKMRTIYEVMKTKITENDIKQYAIEQLEKLGYNYIYAPDAIKMQFNQLSVTKGYRKW